MAASKYGIGVIVKSAAWRNMWRKLAKWQWRSKRNIGRNESVASAYDNIRRGVMAAMWRK
jgi:hypothetical protein